MSKIRLYPNGKTLLILLIILVIGSFLRLWGIEYQSLWNDELSTWARSNQQSVSDVINLWVKPDIHPPGYQVLMYYIFNLFGYSELSLRLPSAIAGILSIFVIYLLGAKMFNNKTGVFAAALLSVFWCPIEYSQEARSYSLLLLFTILSMFFWYDIALHFKENNKIKIKKLIAYILSATICAYLHYFGLLMVVLQGFGLIFYTGFKKKKLLYYFILYFSLFLLYLPWIPSMLGQFGRGPDYITPPQYNDFIFFFEFLFNWSENITLFILVIYIFLFVITIINIVKEKTYKSPGKIISMPEILLGLWLLLPFIITFIISKLSVPVFTLKNLIISLPAAYLLIAYAISKLPVHNYIQYVIVAGFSLVLIYHLIFKLEYYNKPKKEQFRESTQYFIEKMKKYPQSKAICYTHNYQYFNFYLEKYNCPFRFTVNDIYGGQNSDTLRIDSIVANTNSEYLLYIWGHINPEKEFLNYLNENHDCIEACSFIGCRVEVYDLTPKKHKI